MISSGNRCRQDVFRCSGNGVARGGFELIKMNMIKCSEPGICSYYELMMQMMQYFVAAVSSETFASVVVSMSS